MSELAECLVHRGNAVTVLTIQPDGRTSSEDSGKEFSESEIIEGVKVLRVSVPSMHPKNLFLRGVNTLLGSRLLSLKSRSLLKQRKRFDSVLFYSPPITLIDTAARIAKSHRAKLLMVLRDLFPQNAIDLGILKNRAAIKIFQRIEKRCYRLSDIILPQTDTNKDYLIANREVPRSKIEVLYNWVNTQTYRSENSHTDIHKEFGLNGQKICLYAGTMGPAQGLEKIIESAEHLKSQNVVFLFAGNGRSRKDLEYLARRKQLDNVFFRDYYPSEIYPRLVKSADLGIISLSKENHTPIVPGKLVGYMAGGLPIVAMINKESTDLMRIIDESQCGKYVIDGDSQMFAKKIEELLSSSEMLLEHKRNALDYVERFFSVETAARTIEELSEREE